MALIELHHQLRKFFLILFFSAVSAGKFMIVDQVAKYLIRNFLLGQQGYYFPVTSFFDLVYSWNYGISFGMFNASHSVANAIFIILNSIITIYIWYLMFKSTTFLYYQGYGLIMGGAIGNLVDRVVHGAVFDFLYFHLGNFGFPAFNLADTFIFLGVALVIYAHYKESKTIAKEKEEDYNPEDKELADAAALIKRLDEEIANKEIK